MARGLGPGQLASGLSVCLPASGSSFLVGVAQDKGPLPVYSQSGTNHTIPLTAQLPPCFSDCFLGSLGPASWSACFIFNVNIL